MKQVAVITGALGGIGRALCEEFDNAGYLVIGIDRAQGSLSCASLIRSDVRDLVSPQAREKLVAEITGIAGNAPIAVLVNNAAVQILGATEEITLDDWRETLDTNLLAPFVLTQMLLAELTAAKGSVINVASVHATATKPRFVCYATSKAALVGLTKSMAVDLGPKLRVNAILPAAVSTPMLLEGFAGDEARFRELGDAHPLRRIAAPKEVAAAALFLASEAAAFMTGACLQLDGGVSSRLHDPI